MALLHMTKVAVGCDSADYLRERIAARTADGEAPITTRYAPKQAGAMIGGSLFWIIKHRLVARQTILGFATAEDGKCIIRLDARLIHVRARPKRAHQGWRYLKATDAPIDHEGGGDMDEMPAAMIAELSALALI